MIMIDISNKRYIVVDIAYEYNDEIYYSNEGVSINNKQIYISRKRAEEVKFELFKKTILSDEFYIDDYTDNELDSYELWNTFSWKRGYYHKNYVTGTSTFIEVTDGKHPIPLSATDEQLKKLMENLEVQDGISFHTIIELEE
jgi:hypothetical protein